MMDLDYTSRWRRVKSTVANRLLEDSLLHTLSPDKKIKRKTKFLNQKLDKTVKYILSYKQYLSLKKQVEKACQTDDETDDELKLSHDAYKEIYNNQKPKSQVQTSPRPCTQTEKNEYSVKSEGKSPTHESKESNEARTVERFDYREANVRKGAESTEKTSISNFNNPQSNLSKTESELSQRRLLNRRVTRSLAKVWRDNHIDETTRIEEIVRDLTPNDNNEQSVDDPSTSESETVELTDIEDTVIIRNLSEEPSDTRQECDVKNRSKTSLELERDSVASDNQEEENCNIIIDVTEDPNASNLVPNSKEISNNDNLLTQEDMFLTDDETLNLEETLGNRNNNKEDIDSLNHDSGNNSLSDTDVTRAEHGKDSDDKTAEYDYRDKGFVVEHCFSVNDDENSIAPDNVFELEENVIQLNSPASVVSLDIELKKNVELSNDNSDSEGSEDISAEQIYNSQSKDELSTESAASNSKSKLKIRTIERYDKGYDIFCKHQLRKEKRLKTVNNFGNKSTDNELVSDDEQLSASRRSSNSCYSPRSESQHSTELIDHDDSIESRLSSQDEQSESQHFNRSIDYEDSIETKSTDDKSPPQNQQHRITSKKPSKNCNLSKNKSQLHTSDLGNFNNSANNQTLLESEEQTEGNKSFEENSTSETKSPRLNRSLNSSCSSFTARSYDEDLINSVKIQLLSEIEQRLKDTPRSKKKTSLRSRLNSSNESSHDEADDLLSLFDSNEEDVEDKLIDDQPLSENDTQLFEDTGSAEESDHLKILSQSLDGISDIEESYLSPKSSVATKRKNSSSATDHHLLDNTPRSNKMPRLHKANTKRQLELISCKRKSQETISHESQQKENTDNSHDRNTQELSLCENAHHTTKRKPRPQNLEDFVAMEELTEDTTKPYFRLKDIDDDDEFWIMEVPKKINPKDLEDQILLLGGKSRMKFGDEFYKVSSKPAKGICNVSCIFATSRRKKQYKIANVESKGRIKFRQRFSVTPETKPLPSKIGSVPFPKGLKIRHPLFGATYEDKI